MNTYVSVCGIEIKKHTCQHEHTAYADPLCYHVANEVEPNDRETDFQPGDSNGGKSLPEFYPLYHIWQQYQKEGQCEQVLYVAGKGGNQTAIS